MLDYKKHNSTTRDLYVEVLIGPPGCGKTSYVMNKHKGDVCKLNLASDKVWFDTYFGQDVLLLDDYYGQIPYPQLLGFLDIYIVNLPVKGGFVIPKYTKVYITSNDPIESWYPDVEALKRRINFIKNYFSSAIQTCPDSEEDISAGISDSEGDNVDTESLLRKESKTL